MAFLHFDNVGIAALAGALPEHVQTIDMDPDHPRAAYIANFVKQTGVRQRHISITEQTATDLGHAALQSALKKAGWQADSLDALIFMSQTPDFNTSTSNSHVLHNHMHLPQNVMTFDITLGCSSFPYGLSVCASLLQQSDIRRVAMVSGDTVWHGYASPEAILADQSFLFGEGATALLLEQREAPPIDIALYSDGSGYFYLYDPCGGARNAWRKGKGLMPNGEIYDGTRYMDGMEITSFATIRVVESIRAFLDRQGKTLDDFDGIVLHQANIQIIKAMTRRLKINPNKVPVTIDRLGNTSGVSVSLTMIDAYAGQTCAPLRLLASGFGIGLSWGEVSLTLDPRVIVPMQICTDCFTSDLLKPVSDASGEDA